MSPIQDERKLTRSVVERWASAKTLRIGPLAKKKMPSPMI